jgi:hypothetical protein
LGFIKGRDTYFPDDSVKANDDSKCARTDRN